MFIFRLLTFIACCFLTQVKAVDQTSAPSFTTIMNHLSNPVSFSILVSELQKSLVRSELEKHGTEKCTLLAPTDKAFNDFGQIGALRGTPLYANFFKYLILPGLWTRKRLLSNRTVKTKADVIMSTKNIGQILYSVETDNGIIHVIDKIIIHPDVKKKLNIK